MATTYPLTIDSFSNPVSGTLLNAPTPLRHSEQHTNINDATRALQTRVGVTGSTVPATIDYELHNIAHGHDHDGINSRITVNKPFAAILSDRWGPFEGYATGSLVGAYEEIIYIKNIFVISKTWYTDQTKTKKIIEKKVTRNNNKTTNTITWNVFEKDGLTIRTKVIDSLTYIPGTIVPINVLRTVSSSINYIL